jgi:hypothetical protein
MLCGPFRERSKNIILAETDCTQFQKLLDLICSKEVDIPDNRSAMNLAIMADQFQMTEISNVLENILLRSLQLDACAEVLSCQTEGLPRLVESCRAIALSKFDQVSCAGGFLAMSEEVFGALLDDDGLVVENEERVYEAVIRWMQADKRREESRGLLSKVRFGLIDATYLSTAADSAFPDPEWWALMLAELGMVRQCALHPSQQDELLRLGPLRHVGDKVLRPRLGLRCD